MIGNFKSIHLIGKGAFGCIYSGVKKSDHFVYIIKQIQYKELNDDVKKENFNEIRFLASFDHPHIIKYYDSFFQNDKFYIVMEYGNGGDLGKVVAKNHALKRHLDEGMIWSYFLQILLGINALHSKRVIHRDIKTRNIFICENDRICIGDLGCAKYMDKECLHSQVGTPYYMSPEIIEGRSYTLKSDIWSIGVVLYELVCLVPPFNGKDRVEVGKKVSNSTYKPIPSMYSQNLKSIVSLCLMKNETYRPTIHDLLKNNIIIQHLITLTNDNVDKFILEDSTPIYPEISFFTDSSDILLPPSRYPLTSYLTPPRYAISINQRDCKKSSSSYWCSYQNKSNKSTQKLPPMYKHSDLSAGRIQVKERLQEKGVITKRQSRCGPNNTDGMNNSEKSNSLINSSKSTDMNDNATVSSSISNSTKSLSSTPDKAFESEDNNFSEKNEDTHTESKSQLTPEQPHNIFDKKRNNKYSFDTIRHKTIENDYILNNNGVNDNKNCIASHPNNVINLPIHNIDRNTSNDQTQVSLNEEDIDIPDPDFLQSSGHSNVKYIYDNHINGNSPLCIDDSGSISKQTIIPLQENKFYREICDNISVSIQPPGIFTRKNDNNGYPHSLNSVALNTFLPGQTGSLNNSNISSRNINDSLNHDLADNIEEIEYIENIPSIIPISYINDNTKLNNLHRYENYIKIDYNYKDYSNNKNKYNDYQFNKSGQYKEDISKTAPPSAYIPSKVDPLISENDQSIPLIQQRTNKLRHSTNQTSVNKIPNAKVKRSGVLFKSTACIQSRLICANDNDNDNYDINNNDSYNMGHINSNIIRDVVIKNRRSSKFNGQNNYRGSSAMKQSEIRNNRIFDRLNNFNINDNNNIRGIPKNQSTNSYQENIKRLNANKRSSSTLSSRNIAITNKFIRKYEKSELNKVGSEENSKSTILRRKKNNVPCDLPNHRKYVQRTISREKIYRRKMTK